MALAEPGPGSEAAKELYKELEVEVFEELEHFVSDPNFVNALERPVRAPGRSGFLGLWNQCWAPAKPQVTPALTEMTPTRSAEEPLLMDDEETASQATDPDDQLAGPSSSGGEQPWVLVDKQHAVEAMAFYIAACILDMPESQALTPKQLQRALQDSLRHLKRTRFQKACTLGHRVYRWTAYGYSTMQLCSNPFITQAVITALWAMSRVGVRMLL